MYMLCIQVQMWHGKGSQNGGMWHIQSIGKRKYLPQSNVKRIANVGLINSLLILIGIHIRTHLLIRKSKTMNQSKNQSESPNQDRAKFKTFDYVWLPFNPFRTEWRFHFTYKGIQNWTQNVVILYHHQKRTCISKKLMIIGKMENLDRILSSTFDVLLAHEMNKVAHA